MTLNEYRLVGMAQWERYGRNVLHVHNGDTLRIPYYAPIPVPLAPDFNAVMSKPPSDIRYDYRRSVKRFISDNVEYEIIEIEMLLQDNTWELIERWITWS